MLALLSASTVGCGNDSQGPARAGPAKPTATPSLALIDVSGLRRDDVFPAGEPRAPGRRFFDGAASFAQMAATSDLAAASLASVFTGYTPHDSGFSGSLDSSIPDSVPTLLGWLDREGYAVGGFVRSTAVSAVTLGLSAGLEQRAWRRAKTVGAAAADAVAWLGSRPKDKPFVLFVVLEPEARGDAAGISSADKAAGEVLDALRGPSIPKDLVTLAFDHGDDASPPAPPTSPPREMPPSKRRSPDDHIRVPMAISGPAFPPGVVRGSASLADVLPTMRDLMGLPPPRASTDGRSGRWPRRPTLPGARSSRRAGTCRRRRPSAPASSCATPARSSWRCSGPRRRRAGPREVYDLAADPREASPLAKEEVARFGVPFQVDAGAAGRARREGERQRSDQAPLHRRHRPLRRELTVDCRRHERRAAAPVEARASRSRGGGSLRSPTPRDPPRRRSCWPSSSLRAAR